MSLFWKCRMSVTTALRNARACETTMSVLSHSCRYSSSHITACRSRWFVGSSSSSTSGEMKSARASATRMRQPPEKEEVVRCCMAVSKPRPARMAAARAGAESASISSSRSYTSRSRDARSAATSSSSSSSCSAWSSASSVINALRSTSVASTHSSTLASPPGTSCSMCRICRCAGIPSNRLAVRNLRRVVLPMPLRPMRPYRRPKTRVKLAPESSSSAPSCMLTSRSMMSDVPARPLRQCSTTGSAVSPCRVSSRCIERVFSRRRERLSSLACRFSILRRRASASSDSSSMSVFEPRDIIDELKFTFTGIASLRDALISACIEVSPSFSLSGTLRSSARVASACIRGSAVPAPARALRAALMIARQMSLTAAPSSERQSSSSGAIASMTSSSS
mmetsp:Transcript_2211/g.5680  ORF Transcript_2211/g.5680 Transcript_2211/m.5680 type:complete len:394 (+) Transcript_2211:948-2129(+)